MEDKIVCPLCGYIFDNSYEYIVMGFETDGAESIIECESCAEEFSTTLSIDYTFSTETIVKS